MTEKTQETAAEPQEKELNKLAYYELQRLIEDALTGVVVESFKAGREVNIAVKISADKWSFRRRRYSLFFPQLFKDEEFTTTDEETYRKILDSWIWHRNNTLTIQKRHEEKPVEYTLVRNY